MFKCKKVLLNKAFVFLIETEKVQLFVIIDMYFFRFRKIMENNLIYFVVTVKTAL